MHAGASSIAPKVSAFTGDLSDGSGVLDAIQGVDAVVHCASDPCRPESDVAGITNLIRALEKSDRDAHLVHISIVGVDALPWRYYRAKRDVERAIETSGGS
jgi:uncharacterized protein YbjT (DUF2867 family)